MNKLLSISDKMINKCESVLRGLNVTFYIVREDGTSISNGDLIVKEKKRMIKKRTVPMGTYSRIFEEEGVANMQNGEVKRIDCRGHDPKRVQPALSAYAIYRWGVKSCTVVTGSDYVEIMRHEPWEA